MTALATVMLIPRARRCGDDLSLTEQAPCDPDSYYRDLDASGRLQEHFNR